MAYVRCASKRKWLLTVYVGILQLNVLYNTTLRILNDKRIRLLVFKTIIRSILMQNISRIYFLCRFRSEKPSKCCKIINYFTYCLNVYDCCHPIWLTDKRACLFKIREQGQAACFFKHRV